MREQPDKLDRLVAQMRAGKVESVNSPKLSPPGTKFGERGQENRHAIIVHRQSQLHRFIQEMRELGIHVGMGNPPRCITCWMPWPCKRSINQKKKEES